MCITGGHKHGTLGIREVDQIKLMVTGGIMTAGEGMQESQFLLDEIQAATEVAHQRSKKVCMHAWGTEGVKMSIRGEVDCIEHGLLDDETAEMMVAHGVFYAPTIHGTQNTKHILESGLPDFMVEKVLGSAEAHLRGFRKALKAGVRIDCGADSNPSADFTLSEIEHLVRAGMGEMETLIAATQTSADLCGVADHLGTVEKGKLADLIVVSTDPLEDISNVRKLKLVLKDGKLTDINPPEGLADFRELFM